MEIKGIKSPVKYARAVNILHVQFAFQHRVKGLTSEYNSTLLTCAKTFGVS